MIKCRTFSQAICGGVEIGNLKYQVSNGECMFDTVYM